MSMITSAVRWGSMATGSGSALTIFWAMVAPG